MATIIEDYGYMKLKQVRRNKQGAPTGLRTGWTEYQVWHGRRIVSRHQTFREGVLAAREFDDKHWDEIAKQLAQ